MMLLSFAVLPVKVQTAYVWLGHAHVIVIVTVLARALIEHLVMGF